MVTPNIHTSEEWEKEPTRRLSGAHLRNHNRQSLSFLPSSPPGRIRRPHHANGILLWADIT